MTRRSAGQIERLPTGIQGFDQIALGGLPAGRSTLVAGTTGSGKTLFAVEFLGRGITRLGQPGVFVTFEESMDDIRRNARSFGFDIEAWEAAGAWAFVDASDDMLQREPIIGSFGFGALVARIQHAVRRIKAVRVAIDSLAGIFTRYRDDRVIRHELLRLTSALASLNLTTVMTAERAEEYGPITRHGVEEFVLDNVVILRNVLRREQRRRTVEIAKLRGAAHRTGEWHFGIDPHAGIVIIPAALPSARLAPPEVEEATRAGPATKATESTGAASTSLDAGDAESIGLDADSTRSAGLDASGPEPTDPVPGDLFSNERNATGPDSAGGTARGLGRAGTDSRGDESHGNDSHRDESHGDEPRDDFADTGGATGGSGAEATDASTGGAAPDGAGTDGAGTDGAGADEAGTDGLGTAGSSTRRTSASGARTGRTGIGGARTGGTGTGKTSTGGTRTGEAGTDTTSHVERRVSSGNTVLDRMLHGGPYQGSITLVAGPMGSGKTLTALNFAYAGIRSGERCLFYSFDETREQIYRNGRGWGIDLAALEDAGQLLLITRYPETSSPEEHLTHLRRDIADFKPHRLVIDSVGTLARVVAPRHMVKFIVSARAIIDEYGITCWLTSSSFSGRFNTMPLMTLEIARVADVTIALRLLEHPGEVQHCISVQRSRGSGHDRTIRRFVIDGTGMRIGEPMTAAADLPPAWRSSGRPSPPHPADDRADGRADDTADLDGW